MKPFVKTSIIAFATLAFISFNDSNAASFSSANCSQKMDVKTGKLCALAPSKTDSRIKDDNGRFGAGLGYHVIGLPKSQPKGFQLHIHLTGSYGKPYNPNTKEFADPQFLSEAMEAGKTVIQLAYDNQKAVNLDICKGSGAKVDNCAGLAREEKLTGRNVTSLVNTAYVDGIDFRISKAVEYLKKKKVFPNNFTFNWSNTSVSGHSQGAGMSLYIAKKRKVKSACLIAGGYDVPDTVGGRNQEFADWITASGMATSKRKITAVVHTDDDYYEEFVSVYKFLDLYLLDNVGESSKRYMTDFNGERITTGHPAAVKAVQLKSLRMKMCYNQ